MHGVCKAGCPYGALQATGFGFYLFSDVAMECIGWARFWNKFIPFCDFYSDM